MTGTKMSEDNKRKLIEANKNRKMTDEERQHLSDFFYGDKSGLAILTEDQVREIKTRLVNGEDKEDIAKAFGVSEGCIQNIRYGNRWKKTTVDGWEEYQATLPHPHVVTEEQEREIAEKLASGETRWKIHKQYHVSYDKMRNIAKKYGI